MALENKHKDDITLSYFDKNVPNYKVMRYQSIIKFINKQNKENSSLLDVGCGNGAVLEALKNQTNIMNFTGMDISLNYLNIVEKKIGCEIFNYSILDEDLSEKIDNKFDYIIVGAMLHHLIGKNREESKIWATKALQNAFKLLHPKGYLIILEPIYSPKISMDLIFNLKKIITNFTSNRINILRSENNIGAPVVSYYDKKTLINMMKSNSLKEPIFEQYIPLNILFSMKLIGIKERGELLLIYQKN